MGRKRWWKGGSSLILLFLLFIHGSVQGDGEVGCLFDKNVCTTPEETCFNDNAFGRCIRPLDTLDDGIYRYDLDPEALEVLGAQLENLVADNYDWAHPYTQCIMQNALYTVRYGVELDRKLCQDLEELNGDTPFVEFINDNNPEEDVLQPLAVVNFMPTRGHGYGDFANELYSPPILSPFEERRLSSIEDDPDVFSEHPIVRHPTLNFGNNDQDKLIFKPEQLRQFTQPDGEDLYDLSRDLEEERRQQEAASQTTVFRSRRRPRGESARTLGEELQDYLTFLKGDNVEGFEINTNLFPRLHNKSLERVGLSQLDNLDSLEFLKNEGGEWNKFKDDAEEKEEELFASLEGDEMTRSNGEEVRDGIYTEGGLVQPPNLRDIYEQKPENIELDDFPAFLWSRDFTGFKRPERLDVKKPGPLFSTNNYAFKSQTTSPINQDNELIDNEAGSTDLRAPLVKKELIAGGDITRRSLEKDVAKSYDNVDLDYVYIQFNEEFHTWMEGEAVVEKVAQLLGLKDGDLSGTRVGRAEVTFKVEKNTPNLNAMDIVSRLDEVREELQKAMKRNIVRAGIGDKAKLPPMLEVKNVEPSMSSTLFAAIVAAGVTAAAAAAVVTLVIARRHAKSRAKLAGLATPDPEASKDYQELCRARMQAKQPAEKPESPRVMHLSRESESNRSSTSSWGEEAASLSNMDISTGHMVLSYMEDHIKNKDRLDQEWAAICAYEAEPSSVTAAMDASNAERNRPGSAFPYDHSRVVLNDLANLNNSDYINASTITDHDPRNPAYIATQGPLPQTSADFWQLVWEQGSIVIVMLTRLTEEGRAMCHRYWPEEGSELYHIYEVHLVSEHIWCDDYLVRSFYLKNQRTGETRTVTQFHFLSWPENGVPQSTKALLEFRRKLNKSYRGRSCPIVVHCSDGAGRTGTYCLIDMVLNRMAKGAKEIDIAAALEHIRDQRPGMVATIQQFEFVLVAVAEEVTAILKALPVADKPHATAPPSTAQGTTGNSSDH